MGLQADKLAEVATLKSRVLAVPAALHAARKASADAGSAHEAIVRDCREYEAEIAALVNGETDMAVGTAAPKARYSNDSARKAEVTRRLGADAAYQTLARALQDAALAKQNAGLDVSRAEDEHRAWRAVVDLTIAEISLLVAGR